MLDDYRSAAAAGRAVQATRRTRFATFPPYLTLVVKRWGRPRQLPARARVCVCMGALIRHAHVRARVHTRVCTRSHAPAREPHAPAAPGPL